MKLIASCALVLLCPALQAQEPPSSIAPRQSGAFYWADFDVDGQLDAYVVLPEGRAKLLRGQRAGGFLDMTLEAGLEDVLGVHQAQWIDVNGDTRLDLFLASWTGGSRLLVQGEGGLFAKQPDLENLWSEVGLLDVRALDFNGDRVLDLQLITSAGDRVLRGLGKGQFALLDLGFTTAAPQLSPNESTVDEARVSAGLDPVMPTTPGDEALTVSSWTATPAGAAPVPSASQYCPPTMLDSANGACLIASSLPTFGALYPLGNELFIEANSGYVGIGTTQPLEALDVNGSIRTSGVLIAGMVNGPPLQVSSSDKVIGLNVDLLDGFSAGDFSQLGATIETGELADGSVTTTKLAPNAVTGGEIAPAAVGSSQLASGAVVASKLANGSVGSAAIEDGQIADVDISPTASIHGTKVVPDFGNLNVFTGGSVTALSDVNAFGEIRGFNHIYADYGTAASPTFSFNEAEPTGLASPTANALHFITNGVARLILESNGMLQFGSPEAMRISPQGEIGIGTAATFDAVRVRVENDQPSLFGYASFGVLSENIAPTGVAIGVQARVDSPNGTGVVGYATSGSGNTFGVTGTTYSSTGVGVRGTDFAGNVTGELSSKGIAVRGVSSIGGVPAILGTSTGGTYGDGVEGNASGVSGYGVWGKNTLTNGYGLFATGSVGATGVKTFVAPHPVDASVEIRFVSLEGNESGTYFRGSAATQSGVAVIEVPEEFRYVTGPDGMTVQVTGMGPAMLWVESKSLEQIVVRSNVDVPFDYFVNGIRLGYADFELLAENRAYRPTEAGMPYGAWLPDEVRQLLVDNGTLNLDFTPNEATAASLGWSLDVAGTAAAERDRVMASPPATANPTPQNPGPGPVPRGR